MSFTTTKTETVDAVIQQDKKAITNAVAHHIEEIFRQSENSKWLDRCLRQDDGSYAEFVLGLKKGLLVQLLPAWGKGNYQLKITLKARDLRNHLVNFLSVPVRGKAYRNPELKFLQEALTADANAEIIIPIDVSKDESFSIQEKVNRHTQKSNGWFNGLIREHHQSLADLVLRGAL